MHRGERNAWLLLGVLTATLVLLAAAIYTYEYLDHRRIAECQDDLRDQGVGPRGDEWSRCEESGDWGGN